MTAWTVQCGYAAYYAQIVTVEADSLDGALATAVEQAGDSDGWYTRRPFATAQRSKAVAPLLRGVRLPAPADAPPPAVSLAADPNPAILAAE